MILSFHLHLSSLIDWGELRLQRPELTSWMCVNVFSESGDLNGKNIMNEVDDVDENSLLPVVLVLIELV